MYLLPSDFRTARLRVEYFSESIFESWLPFFHDREDLRYLGLDHALSDEELCRAWIKRQMDRNKEGHGAVLIYPRSSNELIGNIGLIQKEVDGEKIIELGYSSLKSQRGKGYMTEAALAIRDYAFRKCPLDTLYSMIDKENMASQKIATKNGMIRGKSTICKGQAADLWHIHRSEWNALMAEESDPVL